MRRFRPVPLFIRPRSFGLRPRPFWFRPYRGPLWWGLGRFGCRMGILALLLIACLGLVICRLLLLVVR
jgi:hypothetical protein